MSRPLAVDDLVELAVPSQPALTSDGARIVYTLRTHDFDLDIMATALWVVEGDQPPRPLTDGTTDSDPAWAPDDSRLAFLRDQQIWTIAAGDDEPVQLTTLPLGAGAPVWSPDGAFIAFTAAVSASTGADPNAPIDVAGVDRLDGDIFLHGARMQVHVLDVGSGSLRQVTDGEQHALTPAWSPDGRTIAFTSLGYVHGDLDIGSSLHLVDVAGGASHSSVVAFEHGFAATVCFTPDGERMVVAGWIGRKRGHARLYAIDRATGSVTDLCPEIDRNVMWGELPYLGAPPEVVGDEVLFFVRDRGWISLRAVPLAGGPRVITGREDSLMNGLSVAGSTAAVVLGGVDSFGEVVTIDLHTREVRIRTNHGEPLAPLERFERVPRDFTISDGTIVQGWVVRADSTTGPSPLLLDAHGGPHGAWNGATSEVHLYHQELVAAGWTVLLLNPRGSDGYGEAFREAVFGGWGAADMADFLEPIDVLVSEGIADPERLAVTGYSYGGYVTCYLTARDGRFAAAVAGGLISDLTSLGGTSSEAHVWSANEFDALPWRASDRGRLATMSPYTFVEQVITPTLVLHGVDDLVCPVGQAHLWHSALRDRGVDTRLVLYPGGRHGFPFRGRPSHRHDYNRRVIEWMQQHVGGKSGFAQREPFAEVDGDAGGRLGGRPGSAHLGLVET